jgi:hypothetical protein
MFLGRSRRMRSGLFGGAGRRDDARLELLGGLLDAREQRAVRMEVPGGLIEMLRHTAHGVHAIREQVELRGCKADAAVERLAHPMFQRGREPDAMPGLGHA